jgi:small conductance mechanosensitive channel
MCVHLLLDWLDYQPGSFMGRVVDEWIGDSQEFVHTKLPHLIGIALIALFLNKLLHIVTRRMVRVAETHAAGPGRIGEVKTLAGVIHGTGLGIIGTIAGLQILDALGMNLGPLLASAGIAGVAIGLAAQTIVKDMFNGILILVEGQFKVGDVVKIAGVQGNVEAMTLRKTTIRDGDGIVYVIPNSQITTSANLSCDYSVATVSVAVDFSADPDEVIALLKQIATDVRNMEPFRDVFKAEPQVLGVDAVRGSQLIFPVVFKTLPTQQYAPVREFQRRVRLALEEHGLLPGDSGRIYGVHTASARAVEEKPAPAAQDATTLKPQETNPFSGE